MSNEKNGSNDGFKNNFYKFKPWVYDVDTLAESLNLDGFLFNVLKSLFGVTISRHDGTNPERDLNKLLHYSLKSSIKIRREKNEEFSDADMVYILYSKLDKKEKEKFDMLY